MKNHEGEKKMGHEPITKKHSSRETILLAISKTEDYPGIDLYDKIFGVNVGKRRRPEIRIEHFVPHNYNSPFDSESVETGTKLQGSSTFTISDFLRSKKLWFS